MNNYNVNGPPCALFFVQLAGNCEMVCDVVLAVEMLEEPADAPLAIMLLGPCLRFAQQLVGAADNEDRGPRLVHLLERVQGDGVVDGRRLESADLEHLLLAVVVNDCALSLIHI